MTDVSRNLGKYSNLGEYFLVTPSRTLIVYGDTTKYGDLVIRTKTNLVTNEYGFCDSGFDMNFGSKQIQELYDRTVRMFMSPETGGFVLDSKYVDLISHTINYSHGTHVRFHTDKGELKVSVFNYREFVSDVSVRKENEPYVYESLIKRSSVFGSINYTVDSNTFLKLPVTDFDVHILENGLGNFVCMEDDVEYFIRGQDVQEPIVKFINEQSCEEICLLLDAVSS